MENEKKKKSKKVVIIVGILVLFLVILLLVLRLIGFSIGNLVYNVQMLGIDKDIEIVVQDGNLNSGGYSQLNIYYYIDIYKKKIYQVGDYHIFASASEEEKHYYSIYKTLKLTKEQINDIEYFITQQAKVSSIPEGLTPLYFISGYRVSYNDIKIIVPQKEAPIITQIINDM